MPRKYFESVEQATVPIGWYSVEEGRVKMGDRILFEELMGYWPEKVTKYRRREVDTLNVDFYVRLFPQVIRRERNKQNA